MRALLIVNPHATSTTRLRRDVIARALASAVELEIVETRYRGHGTSLAADAASAGYGLVITLGGDGTVNEAVNGLLSTPRRPAPALAALPGGSANVFARALGLSPDPVDATGQVLAGLAAGRFRSIGLGLADDRYFTFNSGMGLDAEVVRAVEGRRAHGRSVSPALYMRMAGRQFWRLTDRRVPAMHLGCVPEQPGADLEGAERRGSQENPGIPGGPGRLDGLADGSPLFWCTVSNTAPWTYVGRRPVQTNPDASFDAGLDVFGLRSLSTARTLSALRQMLSARRTGPPRGRGIITAHNLAVLTLTADRPVAFQIDGEYVGEREQVSFRSVPDALRVVM
ncbi:MAG TPA: diacylglycerol kinase family protein [Streptosporangiaceae bacterium]|nr:diacylglycerol kinase family protein [Streptosporangiaceae bacterium]